MADPCIRMSKATLARLPFYYRSIAAFARAGKARVSSAELAARVGVDSAQVRRDLSSIGRFGRAGIGYEIPDLLGALEEILGMKNRTEAVLVGVGRLGAALFRYPGFEEYGLRIVALFDSDPAKIGQKVEGTVIYGLPDLARLVRRLRIQMGIITVPGSEAQGVADLLVESGIIAIWNFAPVGITVPPGVMVRDEDLAAGLSHLSRHLAVAPTSGMHEAMDGGRKVGPDEETLSE
ncbi:MAG: redox-sensing transcriptional repressor Rex [Clostridia bacterium]|nr:redox-sensing transcriptional repressor Rex [Clostridia bacterium]